MCAGRVASIHKTSHPRRAVVHVARVVTVWWELWYRTFIRTRDVLCSGPWMALPLWPCQHGAKENVVWQMCEWVLTSLLLLFSATTALRLAPLHHRPARLHRHPPVALISLDGFGNITQAGKAGIEEAVRKATGNQEYQFGDITKTTLQTTRDGIEETVKKVTGNEEYQACPKRLYRAVRC